MPHIYCSPHISILLCLMFACTGAIPAARGQSAPADVRWQKLALTNAAPGDLLPLLYGSGDTLTLPPGVTRVFALAGDTALFVLATPAGIAAVRDAVSHLNIPPRRVRLECVFMTAPAVDVDAAISSLPVVVPNPLQKPLTDYISATPPQPVLQSVSGPLAGAVFASLKKRGDPVVSTSAVTVINYQQAIFRQGAMSPEAAVSTFTDLTVTPRVNADHSLTLLCRSLTAPDIPRTPTLGSGPAPAITPGLQRTIDNGQMLCIRGFTPTGLKSSGKELVAFVTATLLPDAPAPRP